MSASAVLYGDRHRPPHAPSYRRHHGCHSEDCLECDFARELTLRLMALQFNDKRKAILRQVCARIDQDAQKKKKCRLPVTRTIAETIKEEEEGDDEDEDEDEEKDEDEDEEEDDGDDNESAAGKENGANAEDEELENEKTVQAGAPVSRVKQLKRAFERGLFNLASSSSKPVVIGFVRKQDDNNVE